MLLNITEFLGRFHPLLVHLPIGILLIALLLQYLSGKAKYSALNPAVNIVLLIGMLSAFASCVTGYLLSMSGEYDEDTVSWHMWMGIGVAVVSALMYVRRVNKQFGLLYKVMSIGLLVLIAVTGHLGGSLTHGSDYLSAAWAGAAEDTKVKRKPIPDVQQALLYADIIEPILHEKCYGCHGSTKQKGKLRMDKPELLMKGGKNGVVIEPGKSEESELVKRILLPVDDDDHMAPKEKSQLTEKEIAVLQWWIATGATFEKRVNQVAQTEKIKPLLLSFQNAGGEETGEGNIASSDVPAQPVDKAGDKAIEALKQRGAVVMPVAQNSNYVEVNFLGDSTITDKDMALLQPLQKQLFSLKLQNTSVTDSALTLLEKFDRLVRINLTHTKISDKGLISLGKMSNLKYINLVSTGVTGSGLSQLQPLKNLKRLYLYQTNINKAEWPKLQAAFKNVQLDSGGYVVPTLVSDTTEVVPKK
ncbi:c-type cytochrome domain-containing protein [Foetidibacter luteolus]|uniref:c-type cytochrome domain-containing protein n=1 Tax=Foetidibacter luteolus TaxID=2608880 RepID=UPI00129A8FD1|nr:c-type cytochrome domain-containing protein [Foetidibacter luteolus]